MQFTIVHDTLYTYSAPVTLAQHLTRLRPRSDGTQRTLAYALEITPAPTYSWHSRDADGNSVDYHTLAASTDTLRIVARMQIETLRANPYDYLPDAGFDTFPVRYPDAIAPMLAPYLAAGPSNPAVQRFAAEVAARCNAMSFLDALNHAVCSLGEKKIRHEGYAQTAAETLSRGSGACRDLAVLYMEAARAMGYAARFASGYRRGDLARRDRHLHAWAEVFVPGGGWRGWDPVEGLAVADQHVTLAAAAGQMGTMPVQGSFYSSGAKANLTYSIRIAAQESALAG